VSIEPYEGEVIPVTPLVDRMAEGAPAEVKRYDASFEVELDEPADGVITPVPVDAPVALVEGDRVPIIPAWMRSIEGVKATADRQSRKAGYVALFHAIRLPLYVPWVTMWALWGLAKLLNRQITWAWRAEAAPLKRETIIDNDPHMYTKIDSDDRKARGFRVPVLVAEMVVTLAALALLLNLAPTWSQVLVGAVALVVLARVGRSGRRLTPTAYVKARFRKLSPDIVLRAYTVAKLIDPEKNPTDAEIFASTMSRDATNSGSQVVVDLPYGRTFLDAMNAHSKIASGLDVTTWQVFLTPDHSAERRHTLFVTDENPAKIPAGPTPLLDCKIRNIWTPMGLGLDERGRRTVALLMWHAILVGAQPRKGKTFTARHIGLYAALDPWVKLFIIDCKPGAPDWRAFQSVAEATAFGCAPSARDGDPVEKALHILYTIKRHIARAGAILGELAEKHPEMCPEGKLTPELARDPRYPELRVWVLISDEFQELFELDDPEISEEIAGLYSHIRATGPYTGVVLVSATQKPSGIGGSKRAKELFNRYRDNHTLRIALKCGNRTVSESVLGTEAYGEGIDATSLPAGDEARGIFYLYGDRDQVPMVRGYLAENPDVIKILQAARKHRERAGTLSGEAAGNVVIEGEVVDPLADTLSVVVAGEKNISYPRLAARLRETYPERYADLDAKAISARLRTFGVKGKSVADAEYFESGRGQGVARDAVEQAAVRRDKTR
jgi:DNA segregation ATPase FtsK/SpoIIIE, S-DNA-T family